MRQFEFSSYEISNGVAQIRLNRPEQLNAFTPELYAEIRDAIRLANANEVVDVIVVTGTGRSFATGGDLKRVMSYLESADELAIYEFQDALPFETLRLSPKTTIAAVNGICVAGGLVIAASCDLVIASDKAVFGIPEARVGLASSYLPSLLFGRIGMAHLKFLLYTARTISAREAAGMGLINEVVPSELLWERVDSVVAEIRQTSPVARALYKKILSRYTPPAAPEDLYESMRSPEVMEGLRAFAEKRATAYRPTD